MRGYKAISLAGRGDAVKKRYFILLGTGFCAGLINGLFGAGGGLVLVPFLHHVLKFEQKKAQATTIAVILVLSAISLTIYASHYAGLASSSVPFLIGGAVGAPLGALILKRLPNKLLRRLFALFLLYSGARILFFA